MIGCTWKSKTACKECQWLCSTEPERMITMDNDRIVGLYQLCDIMNVSHTTIYRWIEAGLPHTKHKEYRRTVNRFDVEEVKAWARERGLGGEK